MTASTAIRHWMAMVLVAFALSTQASAAESARVTSAHTVASLVTETDAIIPGVAFVAGLRLVLAPGWHTYWQNPGDAGLPPNLDLKLPGDAKAGPLQWPVPQRLAEATLTTYAYTDDLVLPFTITPGDTPLAIRVHAQWLVCRDVCIPEEADLELDLPVGSPTPAPETALITAALTHVPKSAPFSATVTQGGILVLPSSMSSDITAAEFFPTKAGAVQRPEQAVVIQNGQIRVRLGPLPADTSPSPMPGVLKLTTRSGLVSAFDLSPALVPDAAPPVDLLGLMLLALAGGILLNAMPCVFPILAMKAMALARLSGADRHRIQGEAVSYTLGVIVSFVALGAGLVAIRSAGQAAGWGFQFQSPLFVTMIAWLLFAIGLNLSGVFTVGGSLVGRGNMLARKGGHGGSFLTGVLAVVVASPCTAPFMGTAIAGALTLPAASSLSVFLALGIGLALPYGLVAMVPQLASLLPRPGTWMQVLQQFLAFPLYAAVVWLVWVASQQSGPAGVLTAGVGLVAVGLAAWLLGLAEHRTGRAGPIAKAGAAATLLVLGALVFDAGQAIQPSRSEPFTTARLNELRHAGRPVFVNMTASWCLSCLVNDRLALAPAAVQNAFINADVAYLKGDWTNQDPAISTFLRENGQDGVPLYLLYPSGGTPIKLPQLLTEGLMLAELAKLKG